ncbi:MAG: polyketide cyclase [Marmoricola sp.]|jgi:uncharacterized protein YndB with AHSA1/START domain|nr:polyketide cyclase [Marmoricola sp.]
MSTRTAAGTATTIEAVEDMPAIRISRDFAATPAQLVRAHTDPELFVQWVGPDGMVMTIDHWDARTGGSWRYIDRSDEEEYAFRGCFHTVREDRLVQTFTFEGFPDSVALETTTFEDLGEGRTRLHVLSLFDSYASRDGMLSSGMDVGLNAGHRKLDGLLADGAL